MTRINLIPPKELVNQHLVAEYRELPRVFGLVRQAQERGLNPSQVGIPNEYVLGAGHIKFFYDKLAFLVERQRSLIDEMKQRGFTVNFERPEDLLKGIDAEWRGVYSPTRLAMEINRKRIQERLPKGKAKDSSARNGR